ncbi:hypothetical protein [Gluconacetobacter tumulicola]|uniref:Uncharacterized protein n=1 Tax=Gluconacetobacter tumulicola TaxID=1017177 RepID=A0A7W4P733_9PROT|nr:hypothetical protein [Gluconacetobacter tumulicola]MBB2179549.1 hypothetical protein [Gluconacetobacter tumulicola]
MLVPVWLIHGCGLSPDRVGWLMVPMGLGMICTYPLMGRLTDRFGIRKLTNRGALAAFAGTLLLVSCPARSRFFNPGRRAVSAGGAIWTTLCAMALGGRASVSPLMTSRVFVMGLGLLCVLHAVLLLTTRLLPVRLAGRGAGKAPGVSN